MKILFVVPYVPNLIRVRPYNLVRYLAQAGHRVTLATLWSSPEEAAELDALRTTCESILAFPLPRWRTLFNSLTAVPTRDPIQAAYCWNPALAAAIRAEAGNGYDAIHVEHLRGVRYGLHLVRHLRPPRPPVIWDSVDNISYLFFQAARQSPSRLRRWLLSLEARRTAAAEARLPGAFQRVLVTSKVDQEEFHRLLAARGQPPNVDVLPNGVDLDYFCPDPAAAREPATLVISGKMSYHANIRMVLRFVKEIMPRIWADLPDARLWIVGKDPDRSLIELAADPRIVVTGTVPDIRPYLQRATLAVSPLVYGAGIQNKVLEALACATPVVASGKSVAALNNITPGVHLETADDDETFARRVVTLIRDPQRRQQLGQAGRQYVEQHHDWRKIAADLARLYQEAAQACII